MNIRGRNHIIMLNKGWQLAKSLSVITKALFYQKEKLSAQFIIIIRDHTL